MKNILLLFLSFSPSLLFSQEWIYQKTGNSFDGFVRAAVVQINVDDEQQAMLGLVNKSADLNLVWGINEKNGLDNLSVVFLLPNEITPQKVLMAFDEERTNYLLNFSFSEKRIFIENAVTTDFKSYLAPIDIALLFKIKNTVHFRVITEDSKYDFNFPLSGSSLAINKAFLCPTYKKKYNWTDALFETMYFNLIFKKVDDGKNDYSDVSFTCMKYLEKNFGTYFFTQIKSIVSEDENEEFPSSLIFKNGQNDIVAEIAKEDYLKNFYHFSGNPKSKENEKLLKDIKTIELYFEAFQKHTNLIVNNNITIEKFSNLSKKELLPYYKSILNNKELLDYLRIDESIYYNYDAKEYTFEVFTEAWGE
jgi:hypothetical protein